MSLPPLTLMPESRLAAQGSNARRSTGPRTPQGKLRSRWNAFRHGQWASGLAWSDESLQHLGEDPEKFKKLREGLLAAQGPVADPLWVLQLEDLARLYWRRQRLERAWEPMTRHAQGCFRAGAHRIESLTPPDELLLRQLDTVDRAIDRKVRLLLRLRQDDERSNHAELRSAPAAGASPDNGPSGSPESGSEAELGSAPGRDGDEDIAVTGGAPAVEARSSEKVVGARHGVPASTTVTATGASRAGHRPAPTKLEERTHHVVENKRAGLKRMPCGKVDVAEAGRLE